MRWCLIFLVCRDTRGSAERARIAKAKAMWRDVISVNPALAFTKAYMVSAFRTLVKLCEDKWPRRMSEDEVQI